MSHTPSSDQIYEWCPVTELETEPQNRFMTATKVHGRDRSLHALYDHPPMHLPASEGLKATVDSIANVTAADTAIGDIAGTCPPLESVVDKATYENNCRKLAKVLHGNEFTQHRVLCGFLNE